MVFFRKLTGINLLSLSVSLSLSLWRWCSLGGRNLGEGAGRSCWGWWLVAEDRPDLGSKTSLKRNSDLMWYLRTA